MSLGFGTGLEAGNIHLGITGTKIAFKAKTMGRLTRGTDAG
jgi:hypothetical protein